MAKTIEETYQKKTPKEHILLRPDTYIGSVEKETQIMHVYDEVKKKIVQKTISYVPGLYKIFDEIIVNAADNKIRDPSMNTIKVRIDSEKNEISVYNNGRGVPVQIHAKEKVYVPELIFGHLLTSSNYNDDEKKVTGGRNGYGAKLCNIFSKEFIVETADREVKKYYKQRYLNNMSVIGEPEIERYTKEDFTRITFKPDLKRFKMDKLDDDIVSLLKKRVYDMSGVVKNVKVYLNGEQIEIKGFKEYVKLYLPENTEVVHQVINDRWELAFTTSDEQFQQVSFVNSICTSKGGTHVGHVVDQIVEPLLDSIKKKEKGITLKPFQVKSCFFVFINSLITNPAFDSQTKENLTLRVSAFGSKCDPMNTFVKKILKDTNVVERITAFAKAKQGQQLKKTDGVKQSRISGIPKLEDANHAGTSKSKDCTLILTEGDSAKTLAVAGLSVVGRDCYGVFPLRGKLLNVREANHKQIMDNAEISAIKKILGLQHNKVYTDVSTLRYGHIMIMTDQDHDGSHIKGLIINFLDHFYPSLLKIPNFLQEFITPIVRATKGSRTLDFFTIPEFEEFKNRNEPGWHIKYYKGLGTSTSADAKKYFGNLQLHVKSFTPLISQDQELIDLAFSKKKADARKNWLLGFTPGTFLDQSTDLISISDFVNKELILFSMADNIRSIPSVIDGLKPGQRKVIFSCFKRNLKGEIKVAQLVGYVSEQSAYHHGEQSLCSTIVNLAQDYVGSNNINLLLPNGQFGSRLQGGKDAASPRYIFTSLSPLTRLIFNENDDAILTYLNDDNLSIEPEYYVPIIPMILVNGAEGIGTGWSTTIPNFNPADIIKNIRRMLNDKEVEEMIPFYRNFRGDVEKVSDGRYKISGIYTEEEDVIEILELPIGSWTSNYKEYLESLLQQGVVKDFKEYHTEKTVHFNIRITKKISNLKLTTFVSTNNMVCFNQDHKIQKYSSPEEILKEFYHVRLKYYLIRKEKMLQVLKQELIKLENKVNFIREVTEGTLIINKRKIVDISAELEQKGYVKIDGYDYLLNMSISSLTKERMEKLIKEYNEKTEEYEILLKKTPKDLWVEDLDRFEEKYKEFAKKEQEEYDNELNRVSTKGKNNPIKRKNTSKSSKDKEVKKSKTTTKKSGKTEEKKTAKGRAQKTQSETKKSTVKTPKVSLSTKSKPKDKKEEVLNSSPRSSFVNVIDTSSESNNMPWSKYKIDSD